MRAVASLRAVSAPANRTEKEFWETEYYWGDLALPARADSSQPFDRALMNTLKAHAPAAPATSVLEIGCAPAKWLAFYGETFGAKVAGVEYSAKGAELSRRNLMACGVDGTVHEADFFAFPPAPYDLVLSFGFLEHFDDLAAVFARHAEFVRPGGRLVLGVPNFRGVNRAVQAYADPSYLALHNTRAMSPSLLRELGSANGLTVQYLGYLGGFDPSLLRLNRRRPRWHPRRFAPGVVAYAGHRWRALSVAEHVDHPWLSTYLLGVWSRPT